MTAVTESTKRESPKIELAGVDTGEKILVGLRAPEVCANEALTGKNGARRGHFTLLLKLICTARLLGDDERALQEV